MQHRKNTSENNDSYWTPVAELTGGTVLTPKNEYTADIGRLYPDVPKPYHLTWHRSDDELPSDENWNKTLCKALSALDLASAAIHHLQNAGEIPMTPARLKYLQQSLLQASHRLDDVITETTHQYPLPQRTFYVIAAEDAQIKPDLPRVIADTPDRLIFWLPTLPPARRTSDNHIFLEFQGLLQTIGDRPQFSQWHADFIHVFPPATLNGIRDVDNYSYKPLIDALTLALGTRDCTDQFSSSQYNLLSETLPAGCYINISKRSEKIQFFQFFEDLVLSSI